MKYEDRGREKHKAWLFIMNVALLTLIHVTIALDHSWDSLAAAHGRLKRASA